MCDPRRHPLSPAPPLRLSCSSVDSRTEPNLFSDEWFGDVRGTASADCPNGAMLNGKFARWPIGHMDNFTLDQYVSIMATEMLVHGVEVDQPLVRRVLLEKGYNDIGQLRNNFQPISHCPYVERSGAAPGSRQAGGVFAPPERIEPLPSLAQRVPEEEQVNLRLRPASARPALRCRPHRPYYFRT